MSRAKQYAISLGMLVTAFLLPVLGVHLTAAEPQTRRIHVEHFCYGMQPEVIHVNRGDTLILTFTARDTPHSFFLQDYDIDVKVTPHAGQLEVVHPGDPHGDPEVTREVVITAGHPGWKGFFSTKSRFRDHVFCGEMHGFEQGVLIVHPNYLHAGALGVLVSIPLIALLRRRWNRAVADAEPGVGSPRRDNGLDLLGRWPWLKRLLSLQGLQYWLMTIMSVGLYVVILTSLIGTKMAGGNLGTMLVWVVWLVLLIAIMVPIFGRAWCTICPVPMFGDALQRGTALGVRSADDETAGTEAGGGIQDTEYRIQDAVGEWAPDRDSIRNRSTAGTDTVRYNSIFLGLMWPWPKRLDSPATRAISFLCFGTVSILVLSQPRWTAWAIIVLVVLATVLALVFELRAFCRYLCPINSFISLYSPMAKLALRARNTRACERCVQRGIETCLKGNENGWACPYGISVGQLDSNAECGLCLECLRSCSFKNISLYWRPFRLQSLLTERGQAWQALIMFTLAIVYCITFQGPWHSIRDMVNIVDRDNWHLFAVYSASLWLVTLGLVPLSLYILTRLGQALGGAELPAGELFARAASPLVPMGLFIWIAFAIPTFTTSGSFVLSTLSDPFGWGWDLFGTAGYPWWQILPEATPWIQTGLLLIGFACAIHTANRVWSAAAPRRALYGMLPSLTLLFAVTFALTWFFTA